MTVATGAGITLAISAGAPATLTEAGYAALAYAIVGEVSDLGDIPSLAFEAVSWRNLAGRGDAKLKGGYSFGSQTITAAIDPGDAGQALVDTATASDNTYAIRIAHPVIGNIYGLALVIGGPRNYGDVNTIATRQIGLEYVNVVVAIGALAAAFDSELGAYIMNDAGGYVDLTA